MGTHPDTPILIQLIPMSDSKANTGNSPKPKVSDADQYIILNGTKELFRPGITIRMLCDEAGVGARGFAVERNSEIVPRSQHNVVLAEPGDIIEIVHMVGGG